jgi:tetratricopeptide (TPR) repeat protein
LVKLNNPFLYAHHPQYFPQLGRALAKEGISDWQGALNDYNKAITLWGGSPPSPTIPKTEKNEKNELTEEELGVNPYVLTFRGNVLSRIGRFNEAVRDFELSSDIFLNVQKDIARYSDARANFALALYQLGREEEAVKAMNDVIRKNPGYADMYVALAADNWSKGNYVEALQVKTLDLLHVNSVCTS